MEAAQAGATTASTTKPPEKKKVTDRTKAERKLAYLLCAPAVIAMLVVTGLSDRLRLLPLAAEVRPALP